MLYSAILLLVFQGLDPRELYCQEPTCEKENSLVITLLRQLGYS